MKAKFIWQISGLAALLLASCGRAQPGAMTDAPPTQFVGTPLSDVATTVPEQVATGDAKATREARTAFATQFAATARAERTQAAPAGALVVGDSPLSPSVDVTSAFPLAWPAPVLTEDQIRAANACNPGNLVFELYPGIATVADLDPQPLPETACQWAVLAKAYANVSQGGTLPGAGREAFLRTVYANPALVVHFGDLPLAYGNGLSLVDSPPVQGRVRTIAIFAQFRGSDGYRTSLWLEYALFVNVGDTAAVRGNAYTQTRVSESPATYVTDDVRIAAEVDAALAQALANSLENLWPVDDLFVGWGETSCAGMLAYGDLRALVEFTDGRMMMVNATGMPYEGGGSGTLVTLDGQNYFQISTQLYDSLMRLLAGAGAPGPAVAAEVGAINCQ